MLGDDHVGALQLVKNGSNLLVAQMLKYLADQVEISLGQWVIDYVQALKIDVRRYGGGHQVCYERPRDINARVANSRCVHDSRADTEVAASKINYLYRPALSDESGDDTHV